jgi:Flp pilus assembly protein TadD
VSSSRAQLRARAVAAPSSRPAQLDYAYSLQFQSRTRARVVAERALALDATNLDAQVAVIVLGFEKDQPAQAVGRLAQLMRSRPDAPSPRFHFGELLAWIGQQAEAEKQYRQASALDPKGLIGRFARSVLSASS